MTMYDGNMRAMRAEMHRTNEDIADVQHQIKGNNDKIKLNK